LRLGGPLPIPPFDNFPMPTFRIEHFGCRATHADAASIERQLLDAGLARVGRSAEASLVIVNTCTVTARADGEAREAIRRIHRENPAARILATGCYAQRAPEELAAMPGVTWVVGNSHQREIAALVGGPAASTDFVSLESLAAADASQAPCPPKILTGDIFEMTDVLGAPVLGGEGGRTRPVLKIQDGCNNRCAYCVLPFVRGRSRSLPPAQVIAEIARLVAAGAREVVLSGINLGAYGRDLTPRVPFAHLLHRILEEASLDRLRISSIEPMDVTLDLADLVARSGRLAAHFHVPLQSGSDRILAAMHRWYRAAQYQERILRVVDRLPQAAIGADLITGFPGESEEDHQQTLELVDRLPFAYLHVFPYSQRPGTRAAALTDAVPPQAIRRRSSELRALAAQKGATFRAAQSGSTVRALTLHRSGITAAGQPWTTSLSGNYLHVQVLGTWPPNLWLDVRLTENGPQLRGEVVARSSLNQIGKDELPHASP
jgi:threonylcarbamoyladenosine tRNA methylthiotransferase MtaB